MEPFSNGQLCVKPSYIFLYHSYLGYLCLDVFLICCLVGIGSFLLLHGFLSEIHSKTVHVQKRSKISYLEEDLFLDDRLNKQWRKVSIFIQPLKCLPKSGLTRSFGLFMTKYVPYKFFMGLSKGIFSQIKFIILYNL